MREKLLEPATIVSVALRVLLALLTAGLVLRAVQGSWSDAVVGVTDDATTCRTRGAQVDFLPRHCAKSPDAHLSLLHQLGPLPSTLLLISGFFM